MKSETAKRVCRALRYVASNIARGEGTYPFYASFKITNNCNLRCACCDIWKHRTADSLSTSDVHKIMKNLADSSIFALCYEGGEPLLRDDIEEILKYGHGMPYLTSMVTTGENPHVLDTCSEYLDFLHISIDEFHENTHLYERLEEFKARWKARLAVHIVVSDRTLDSLEEKVRRIHAAKVKVCIMPAARLDFVENMYPDPVLFSSVIRSLKRRYPRTIITAETFLRSINNPHGCAASSLIIDSDGGLYYPCRTLQRKPVNLLEVPLMEFLASHEAQEDRKRMMTCTRSCGWYQYFAVSFTSWRTFGLEIQDLLVRLV